MALWVRVEKRNVSKSLSPVNVSGHLLVTGGMINDTSNGSEGEVWRVGPDLWGRHRHDRRLCMGWLDHQWHDQKDGRRGGLGGSGGDLCRPIYEGPEPSRETSRIRESKFLPAKYLHRKRGLG